jgi:hypothetical protein
MLVGPSVLRREVRLHAHLNERGSMFFFVPYPRAFEPYALPPALLPYRALMAREMSRSAYPKSPDGIQINRNVTPPFRHLQDHVPGREPSTSNPPRPRPGRAPLISGVTCSQGCLQMFSSSPSRKKQQRKSENEDGRVTDPSRRPEKGFLFYPPSPPSNRCCRCQ